jgi:penicillin-binding protein 1A
MITLPDLSGLGNKTRAPSISVLDDKTKIMGSLGDVYAGSVTIEEISPNLIEAIVFTEDRRFFKHYGLDIRGLFRAIIFNIKEMRYAQGASTITQQLSKLIFLDSKKTLSRKMRELIISFYLEKNFNKDNILTMYLNRVYFGSGLYGIKSASRRYFLKEPSDLTLAESAILAGTLKAPSKLSFIANRAANIRRAELIISMLYKEEAITQKEKKLAIKELNILLNSNQNNNTIKARYFIDWIYTQTPEEVLRSEKDLLINSTLNSRTQKIVNDAVDLEMRNKNSKIQVAVIVMDYEGAVKAIKGGKNWKISKFNRATQSKRQVGSIFKTYVYLTALNNGFSINDTMLDQPINDKQWAPKNFGNNYEGRISLKRAFAKSSNVIAVKLSDDLGRNKIIEQVKKLGVTAIIPNELSMPLGVATMSLLEVVGSYAPICGKGKPVIPYGIKEINLRNGKNYWKRVKPDRKKIINNYTNKNMKKLLNEVINQGTAKKLSKYNFKIFGKTGTTQNNRDAWFIGCAKQHVIGVWNGRDDDKSMKNIYGSTLPLSIFSNIVEKI